MDAPLWLFRLPYLQGAVAMTAIFVGATGIARLSQHASVPECQFVLQFIPSSYLETMFVYFKERVSLCSPGWPLPFNAPASGP